MLIPLSFSPQEAIAERKWNVSSAGSKTFIGLFVVLVAVAALIAFLFKPVGVDKREAMTNEIAALKTEARSGTQPRSVLGGTASPGDPWDGYNLAFRTVRMTGEDSRTWSLKSPGDAYVDRDSESGGHSTFMSRQVLHAAPAALSYRQGS
jgi:hypothetical protein